MLKLAAYFDSKKRYVRFHNENAAKTCPGTSIDKATFMKEARAYLVKAPVPKPASMTKAVSHTVQKGETFYGIAKQYNMSASDLQKFNPRVTADDLQIGDVIHLIPVPMNAVKPPTPVAPKPVPKPVIYPVPSPPLKEGDKNTRVMQLQKALNAAKFSTGTPDGSFGPKTTNALKRFQSVYANPSDGSYGPKTRDALHKLLN
jgi:LysM repeat protein